MFSQMIFFCSPLHQHSLYKTLLVRETKGCRPPLPLSSEYRSMEGKTSHRPTAIGQRTLTCSNQSGWNMMSLLLRNDAPLKKRLSLEFSNITTRNIVTTTCHRMNPTKHQPRCSPYSKNATEKSHHGMGQQERATSFVVSSAERNTANKNPRVLGLVPLLFSLFC